jgi:hypothetical protein
VRREPERSDVSLGSLTGSGPSLAHSGWRSPAAPAPLPAGPWWCGEWVGRLAGESVFYILGNCYWQLFPIASWDLGMGWCLPRRVIRAERDLANYSATEELFFFANILVLLLKKHQELRSFRTCPLNPPGRRIATLLYGHLYEMATGVLTSLNMSNTSLMSFQHDLCLFNHGRID